MKLITPQASPATAAPPAPDFEADRLAASADARKSLLASHDKAIELVQQAQGVCAVLARTERVEDDESRAALAASEMLRVTELELWGMVDLINKV